MGGSNEIGSASLDNDDGHQEEETKEDSTSRSGSPNVVDKQGGRALFTNANQQISENAQN